MLLLLIRPVLDCSDDSDPTPTISGTAAVRLVLNRPSDDEWMIDLDASTASTYTIKYVTTGTCPDSSTQDVTITPSPTVDLGADIAICDGTTNFRCW